MSDWFQSDVARCAFFVALRRPGPGAWLGKRLVSRPLQGSAAGTMMGE